MQDKEDEGLVHTAVRETEEELGISSQQVDVWGQANFIGTYSAKVAVLPVVGFVGDIDVSRLKTNADEVEDVFTMSLRELCDPAVCKHTQFRSRSLVLPLFVGPQYKVWGLTAVITHTMLKALVPEYYKKKLRVILPMQSSS
jgi:nudix motif 8